MGLQYLYHFTIQPAALALHCVIGDPLSTYQPTRRGCQAFVTPLHRHEEREIELT